MQTQKALTPPLFTSFREKSHVTYQIEGHEELIKSKKYTETTIQMIEYCFKQFESSYKELLSRGNYLLLLGRLRTRISLQQKP